MRRNIIYLAGNISNDPATYEWRTKAKELLGHKYTLLNPTANRFNQDLLKDTAKENMEEFLKQARERSQHILAPKDFGLVQMADIIIVNLALVHPEKPMIGSICEIAWAWYLHKPVIAICNDNPYSRSIFLEPMIACKTRSVEEACAVIDEFFEA